MDYYDILLAKKLNGEGGGEATLIDKNISSNGTYNASSDNADGYKKVVVSVPNSYVAGDEGKVVSNGALVSQSSVTYDSNGTYDTTLKNSVTVNVSNEPPVVDEKDINFYDYDGTLLYSYTKAEWANVTALPPNPSHDGLISQGWNFEKAYIDNIYQSLKLPFQVGQLYVTESGATEIDIELHSWNLSPTLSVCPNGTVSIDWGDNSQNDTLTGTSISTPKTVQHTYASAGNYTIKISLTSGTAYVPGYGTTSQGYVTISNAEGATAASNQSKYYQNTVKRVRIGQNVTQLNAWSFGYCASLETITTPKNQYTTWGGKGLFIGCSSLKALVCPITEPTEPDGTYTHYSFWGQDALQYCTSLKKICGIVHANAQGFCRGTSALPYVRINTANASVDGSAFQESGVQIVEIPASVTEMKGSAFYNCRSLKYIHMLSTSPPALADSNVLKNLAPNYIIYVPTASVDTYKTASTWSSYASHIVGE